MFKILIIISSILLSSSSIFSQNEKDTEWTKVDGKLSQIAVGEKGAIWGIGLDHTVWKWDDGKFSQLKGVVQSISVGKDGSTWCVGLEGRIYKYENNSWTTIPGSLQSISVGDANNIWGISDDESVWRRVGDKWTKVNFSKAKQISVGFDGSVWCLKNDASVWKWDGSNFVKQTGELKLIVVKNKDEIWGLNFFNQAVKWSGEKWEIIYEGSLENFSIGEDGSIWGVKANGNVYKIK